MDEQKLREFLSRFKSGELGMEEAVERLRKFPYEDIGFASVDHHRALRCGFPEVIFCQGKSKGQIIEIAKRILDESNELLLTRVDDDVARSVISVFPDAVHNEVARTVTVERGTKAGRTGLVAVVTAGTSDIPVAEEAKVAADMMKAKVTTIFDVGVAGVHRILSHSKVLADASCIIVVAGMEGALASVVGGMVAKPVIAVPTSIGYGASFNGLAALLGMLNSCASNVVVVNIDNGFGAGYVAGMINRGKS
ncbi:MAG: nickel pincer cofactor biosynthesis protein LarB [Candidatus Eisenbacteria bacterium]|nr:nickel pincer cofactor biosynthesis protein LarB [Candidatus Eisenbacteria bacterium]